MLSSDDEKNDNHSEEEDLEATKEREATKEQEEKFQNNKYFIRGEIPQDLKTVFEKETREQIQERIQKARQPFNISKRNTNWSDDYLQNEYLFCFCPDLEPKSRLRFFLKIEKNSLFLYQRDLFQWRSCIF